MLKWGIVGLQFAEYQGQGACRHARVCRGELAKPPVVWSVPLSRVFRGMEDPVSHDINVRNGEAAITVVGKPAWHNLGTVLDTSTA